jgi:eukaryotic-like serine/threonine-protein kinase
LLWPLNPGSQDVVEMVMSQRSAESGAPSELEVGPGKSASFGAAATIAIEHTLAIPTQPRIDHSPSFAEASTVELNMSRAAVLSTAQLGSSDGDLREPISSNQYLHAYRNDDAPRQELGRGGIGRVVLVFDRTLGRDVAMKELLPELLDPLEPADSADRTSLTQRFLREARITGQLEHPNIVPVYELGRQPSGCLYYTMRVVRGRTLASAIRECTTLADRLALVNHFAGLCQAIAYAHSRGVVHRDIKPENVMIGEFGETFVLDWGLANIVEETSPQSLRAAACLSCPPERRRRTPALAPGTAESFQTQFGTLVGTPLYMSPEQLLQGTDGCSPTSDVWSLGIVLYYILTGRLPFSGSNLGELILQIQAADLTPIDCVAPDVPRDLAAIARRALTRDQRARYPNARAMARDINAYQAGDKVTAYDYSSVELLRRFSRRNRSAVIVAAAALAAVILLGLSSYRRISTARDAAVAAEQRATLGEHRAKTSLSDMLAERARTELSDGDAASATLLAAGALELLERPDARGMLVALSNADRLESMQLPTFARECQNAEWNPALSQLACINHQTLTIGDVRTPVTRSVASFESTQAAFSLNAAGWLLLTSPHTVRLLDANHQLTPFPADLIRPVVFASSPDGKQFAVADDAGRVELWSLAPSGHTRTTRAAHPITAIAFHPTEPLLSLGGYRGDLYLWRWQDEVGPTPLGNAHSTVQSLAFAPKGSLLASGGSDGSVLLWDMLQRQLVLSPLRATSTIVGLSFSPAGTSLAVAIRSGSIDILDTKDYERSLRSSTGSASIRQLAYTSPAELVGVADSTTALRFRIRHTEPRARYSSRGNVLSLAWAANGRDILVAGLGEQGLCHLRLAEGTCSDRLPLRAGLVRKVVHSSDGNLFLVGGTGGRVEIWDAVRKLPRGFLEVPIAEVRDLQLLPDGNRVAVAGNSPTLVIVEPTTMQIVDQQQLPGPVQSMAVLPEARQLAIGLRNGHLLLRSLTSAKIESDVALVSGWPVGIAVSERLGWLAVAEEGGRVSFFDLNTKRLLDTLFTGNARLTAFAYDSQNDLLATGGEGRDIHLISTAVPRSVVARLVDHQGTVRSLLFDSANQRLFSAGDDGMIRLWPLDALRQSASKIRQAAEKEYGMRLEAGRIIRGTGM